MTRVTEITTKLICAEVFHNIGNILAIPGKLLHSILYYFVHFELYHNTCNKELMHKVYFRTCLPRSGKTLWTHFAIK